MGNEPRRHHYLPQFYLSGFTDGEGRLWLIGLQDGRTWTGTPASVGHQRDFYRIDGVPGIEPNDLERGFAQFESQAAAVLRSISATEQVPDGDDDFSILITLVALMMARVPRTRDVFSEPIKQVTKMIGQIIASSEERFRSTYERARREDPTLPDNPNFEKVRQMIETDAYTVEVSQAYQLKQLLQIVETVLPLLGLRLWSLIIAPSDAEFVTSDSPVVLTWTHPKPPSLYGPGFGLRGTDVTFPLTRKLALLGRFEGPAETIRAPKEQVAAINSRTCSYGQRFACSSSDNLIWLMADGSIGNAVQLIASLNNRTADREP